MRINKGSYSINVEPTDGSYKATFSNGGKTLYGNSKYAIWTQLRDSEEITQTAFENYSNADHYYNEQFQNNLFAEGI